MSTTAPISAEALIAREIASAFVGTESGHCARVDFFERQQIDAICDALHTIDPQIALHCLDSQNSGRSITADRAIELRNRKSVRLCLFVPTDLVDAAFSSLANSFAILDGRALLQVALQRIRAQFSPAINTVVREVFGRLRPPLRVSESQKIDFCQALIVLETQGNLKYAGKDLWRVGLIADGGTDFGDRLDRNRRCLIKLAMPLKLQASLSERIATTKVDPATATKLSEFFRNRAMNDYVQWSKALADGEGPAFEQWAFPEEQQSDLREVKLQQFVDRDGKVRTTTKLKQPDGQGGALIAEYGDAAKGISVRWSTDPVKARNVGGWRIEIVPAANPDHHELDLPSRDIPPGRSSTTLKIELDFGGDEEVLPDESFQVRLIALDSSGDVLQSVEDGQDLIALSEEFYIAKADEQISHDPKRAARQRTVPSIAFARLEVALETKADQLDEQEPLWTSRDLEYFNLRLDDRRKIAIGVSRLLKDLEEQIIAEPLSLGRYRLRLDEIDEASFDQIIRLDPPAGGVHWQKFRRLREQVFKHLKGSNPRHLVSVARWEPEIARRVLNYARTYQEWIETLSSDPGSREELLLALSVDTLLIATPKRGGGIEEAIITLPTHPLRMLWYVAYQQLLAQWEARLFELKPKDRAPILDLEQLRAITPANMPLFVTHPEASAPLLHAANLRFFYGIALPSDLADPQRRLADIATILGDPYGLEHDGDSTAMQLADHIKHFRDIHPYLRHLSITQVNADRGELLTKSLTRVFAQTEDSSEDEEREPTPLPRLTIHAYVESDQTGTAQDVSDLRRLFADQIRYDGQAYLIPAFRYTQQPIEMLQQQDPPAAHLAIATDVIQPRLLPLSRNAAESLGSSFSFYGLVCRPIPHFAPQGRHLYWEQHVASDGVKSDPHPVEKGYTETLVTTQVAIAKAASLVQGGPPDSRLGLRIALDPYRQQLLERLHEHSTWVMTIDRHFALDYYDTPHDPHLQNVARKYLIDYNPEFTDGLSHRLIVTTTWRDEIEHVLSQAMDELGFAQLESSVGRVLDALKMVSGQLALQVSDVHNNAAGAVGLGIVVMYLQRSGRLRESILVPVDAAPQIFNRSAEGRPSRERRCDLALFTFKRGVVECTFIEVKWRRNAMPVESLANDMLLQMQSSAALVRSRYFAQPDRADGVLQRARLANVLRFYLERSQRHDLITPESAGSLQDHLSRLEKQEIEFRPKYEGYIITPEAINDQTLLPQGAKIIVRSIASLADGFVLSGTEPQDTMPEDIAITEPQDTTAEDIPITEPQDTTAEDIAITEPLESPRELEADTLSPSLVTVSNNGSESDSRESPYEPSAPAVSTPVTIAEPVVASSEATTAHVPVPAMPTKPSAPEVIDVHLGDTDEQPIIWKPSVRGSPHLFIIGIPGQGKSVAISNVLADLLDQGVAPVILDFHGQFGDPDGSLVQHHGLQSIDTSIGLPFNPFEVMVRNGKLDWKDNAQSIADIFAHVVELGGIQKDGLFQAILDAYKDKGFHPAMTVADIDDLPTPADVLTFIEERENQRKVKNLAARCRPLLEMDLFNPSLTPLHLGEALTSGLVIDLHAVLSESVQMAAGAFVLRKIYREMFLWGEADRIRLVIILDEAHRLAKDQTLPKIMKEGRKYGIAVVVASQGMKDFHPDVLNTAGTKVLFRVNYPESRTLTKYIASPPTKRIDTIVEQLPVGQAFVQTPEMRFGRQVRMRPPVDDE